MFRKRLLWGVALVVLGLGLYALFRMPSLEKAPPFQHGDSGKLAASGEWTAYGGDLSGRRYAGLDQINTDNVSKLEAVWTFHTGDTADHKQDPRNLPAFEATPIKVGDTLYFCTPTNVIFALDAESGKERWHFNPGTDTRGHYQVTCRGVSFHHQAAEARVCRDRILAATLDARLLALDAASGKPCPDFGTNGQVSLRTGQEPIKPGFYSITSPPVVVGDVAVVGGLVLDNQSTDVPSGIVRAYDVRSGELRWAWDAGSAVNPLPVNAPYDRGSPNAWGVFSADESLGLIFVPTGNRSPDYFGGERSAVEDAHASAVVAIEAATGRTRWVFQTVHHDLWDYDVASQPVLVDLEQDGKPVPALVQATKTGQLFLLDRRDGTPLTRVEERPVPQNGVAGERLAATQPYSVGMPSLHPTTLRKEDMWGLTPIDRSWCERAYEKYRHEGLFTPPSLQGTINFPSNLGASNWGSVSVDPRRHILIANTNQIASIARLIPRVEADRMRAAGITLYHPSAGTPFAADIRPFLSPLGIPCNAPPWGVLTAIDLDRHQILWQRPLGTTRDLAPVPVPLALGVPNMGGSLITAGNLIFIGAAADNYLRAFALDSGKELWRARLPAGGQATPMTYTGRTGRQYVVIAAGGHAHLGSTLGDAVVAYALPGTSSRQHQ
ncbi:MAG: pyrroloquinoline quinone-dependent dehydrogenase [Proteobacteria bacterium]|nr:pyrroloquinoline quinone-dependent dehydrogenase [Pseudomonadota bacterium]HQR03072.1 pyrroloquinoline quinone-dependent dehydrogenase [Rhodocyclaceae bacterium]